GARRPAFLIARDAAGDSGFVRASDASFALRREFGWVALTASAESGAVWRGDNLRAVEAMPGGPRDRFGFHSFALAAERRIGPVEAIFEASWLGEGASVLGATFAPALGIRGADSLFLDASAGLDIAAGWRLGAAWRQGWTRIRQAGLVASGSALAASGWSLDASRLDTFLAGDSLGLRLSQPLRVTGGGIGLTLPVAYDYATLLPSYGTRFVALAPSGREIDAELAWRGPLWGGAASASVFYRTDPGHYASLPDDKGVALRWNRGF
ncbi:MAG: peptidase S8, partial [Qipengyuania sp.]|nr:peptidase S8 [Qipengyuania sp.]